MKNEYVELNENEMASVIGGIKKSTLKCYLGTGGSAVTGMLAGGVVGYWAGAAVGYASFC